MDTGISTTMDSHEVAKLRAQVDTFNKALNEGRVVKQSLDKDDFLKILLTQLTHQDPTAPVEDKEFIAQMAQFSSLEQMTNMTNQFGKLTNLLSAGQAMNVLGKNVDVVVGDQTVSGTVSEVTGGDYPQVLVNGQYYDFSQVARIKQ